MQYPTIVKSPLIEKQMKNEVIDIVAKAHCYIHHKAGQIFQHEIDGDDDIFMYYNLDRDILVVFRADEVCEALIQYGQL